jgi:pimeloyl-ACP methyl ester carboxylesterase
MRRGTLFALAALLVGSAGLAQTAAPAVDRVATPPPQVSYGARLEGFDYPFPVHVFRAAVQGQPIEMAYMELAPAHANGRTAVLMHGKNFCGATWGDTARVLAAAGYRVIVPDQVGFCKSSKPAGFQ